MRIKMKWAAMTVLAAMLLPVVPVAQAEQGQPTTVNRNLASGLDYSWSEQPEASRPDGSKKLTDGIHGALNMSDPAWVGHQKKMTREVVFDLGEAKSISKINARFLQDWPTNEALVPLTVSMYVSDDKENWGLLSHNATQLLWGDGPPRDETYTWDGSRDGIKSKPGAQMAYARYVKVTFSMHTRAWTLIDEIEIMGADGKLAGAEVVPPEPVGYLQAGEATAGIRNLGLLYNGYYDGGKGDWSKQRIIPNISYVNKSGEPVDWMFDGVLYLGLSTPEGHGFNGSANMSDWAWYLDKTFANNGDMDQLNAATVEVGAKLNQTDHKTKVVLMIPDPGEYMSNFGDVDGDGVVEDFRDSIGTDKALQNRAKAIQWYVNQAQQKWAEKNYSNLELVGMYWLEEQISTSSTGPATVKLANDIVHAKNLKSFWIPHSLAYKAYMWKDVGFDAVAFQPNYFFGELGYDKLKDASNIAKQYGMTNELEFDDRMVNDGVFRERFVDYLNSGVETGLVQPTIFKAYYQGNNAVYDTAVSGAPSTRIMYDWLNQFVKGTYQVHNEAPPEADVKMNGQALQSGVVVPDTEKVQFTWSIKNDDGSGLAQVTAKFDGKPYTAGTEISLTGKAGKHELAVTVATTKTKTTTYVIQAGMNASSMLKLVGDFKANNQISSADGARALSNHLEMMKRFEGTDAAEVSKYLKGFNATLDQLKNKQGISAEAYNTLKEGVYFLVGSLAQDKPAEVSSIEASSLAPGKAVDGFPATRWSSISVDNTWFQVDLGEATEMDTVRIDWEYARAKTYKLLVSDDKVNWKSVIAENNGIINAQDGKNTILFEPVKARYIKFQGIQRETFYGYSFYEFGVYNLAKKVTIQTIDGLKAAVDAPTKNVTIQGLAMNGKLADVKVKVLDPQGNVQYEGKTAVTEAGDFQIAFTLTGNVEGTYVAQLATNEIIEPIKVAFEYKKAPGGDQTPPDTTAIVSPEQPNGQNGWYKQPVTVSLTAQDAASSVTQTVYSLDGGTAWRAYTAPILFDRDGRYSVSYRSTDREGNVEAPKTISFTIDGTAPVIAVAVPLEGTYSSAEDLTPQFTATDSVSGIDATKTVAMLDGKPVQTSMAIALYTLELGTHEFTVSASDLAGNATSRTVRFQTAASLDSLKLLVKRFKSSGWIDNKGIETSLLSKLNAGNVKSFIQEVEAQAGKHVSNEAAKVLLRDARTL
ncbi:DUF4855 domain-containing protein [Paenibacillus sp. LMG 31458]|uniref:DUF4855 domain-containing protein n=1 Tax=Paenibacillus phytorum TaxID=2654977 RepID=A0ABX1XVX1_9BACL|nr:DUF4855 domain-containing protein [Paenibacillus phytorum]NOU72677.1 DUF4855 domain-containing protein [Paenibacillus phytorum]